MTARAVVTPLGRRAVDIRRRVIVLLVAVLLVAGAALAKLAWLQLVSPTAYAGYGENLREAVSVRASLRGDILDRNGDPLATSVYRPSVVADPTLLDSEQIREVATALSGPLGIPLDDFVYNLVQAQSVHSRYELLSRWVTPELADEVRSLALPGVFIVQEPKREYPAGPLAEAVVGRAADDGTGVSGIEAQFDERLTGEPGQVAYESSPTGTIAGTETVVTEPLPGADLVLTLDLPLQYEVERALVRQVVSTGAKGGTAVVVDTATGELLALASVERLDDGRVVTSTANYPALLAYEPASVMKPITMAAVIDAGLARPDELLDVPMQYEVYDQTFSEDDPHDEQLTPTEILVHSSNVGTVKLAERLPDDQFYAALQSFGFGTEPGLGFPGETAGLMPSLETWREEGTTWASSALGQAIAVSPLQLAAAYNVLANDGEYVQLHLVRGEVGHDGDLVADGSAPSRRVVGEDTADTVTEMMVQVVQRGTAQEAQVPGYRVAAKTGTAQKAQANGTYEDEFGERHYVATVAGFFPADDPLFTMAVVLDEPANLGHGEYYASAAAAPLFGELAAWILHHFDVAPPGALVVGDAATMATERADVPLVRVEAATLPGQCGDTDPADDPADGAEDTAGADDTAGAEDAAGAEGTAGADDTAGADGTAGTSAEECDAEAVGADGAHQEPDGAAEGTGG